MAFIRASPLLLPSPPALVGVPGKIEFETLLFPFPLTFVFTLRLDMPWDDPGRGEFDIIL